MDEEERTELIVIFHNTHEAIMGERSLLDAGIDTRVMPTPAALGPACGIALRVSSADMEKAGVLLGEAIDGIYCRNGEGVFTLWNP
ncbi:MAG: DUF3343 domain-containing protein [Treponema sp.]|jgi:hypothetical protein|nr:DUF3343 domain-containing protein [Treponema sp.]